MIADTTEQEEINREGRINVNEEKMTLKKVKEMIQEFKNTRPKLTVAELNPEKTFEIYGDVLHPGKGLAEYFMRINALPMEDLTNNYIIFDPDNDGIHPLPADVKDRKRYAKLMVLRLKESYEDFYGVTMDVLENEKFLKEIIRENGEEAKTLYQKVLEVAEHFYSDDNAVKPIYGFVHYRQLTGETTERPLHFHIVCGKRRDKNE